MEVKTLLLSLLLALTVFKTCVAATSLVCEDVQDLCLGDNDQRMCTCVVTGNALRWSTNRPGVFDGLGTTFLSNTPPDTTDTEMGFTVIFTGNSMGQLTSIMTYTPTAVSTTGLNVTCDVTNTPNTTNMTFLAGVTNAAEPGPPTLMDVPSPSTCDVMNGAQVTVQWTAPSGTSGGDVVHYEVNVTGPAGTMDVSCSPDCDMVSGTMATISNLECGITYKVKVRAVRCNDTLEGNFGGAKDIIVPSLTTATSATTASTQPSDTAPTNGTSTPTTSSTTATAPSESPVTNTGAIAGGGGAAAAIVALLVIVIKTILICIFCPCACCMPCRRKCCGCCPEEWICCHCGSDDTDGEPVPIVDKGPVVKNKEVVQLETGQPSYPQSAMYQDPSTIERKAAPTTGDLYAQPEKPARHQQQQAMELPTYQDPSTIERQAAATGDMYALPDKSKIPKQPSGPAPALYTEVDRTNQTGTMYAELDHTGNPVPTRRPPPQQPQPVYSDVHMRDTRT